MMHRLQLIDFLLQMQTAKDSSYISSSSSHRNPTESLIRLISRDLAGGDGRSPMQKPLKTIQGKFDEGPSLQVGDLAGCLAHDAKRYMAAGLLDFVERLYGLHRILCSKLRKAFEEGQLSADHVQQCACEITINIAAVHNTPQASRSCSNGEIAERFILERGWQYARGPLPDYGNNLAVMLPGGREHVHCDDPGEVDCNCGSEYPTVCSYSYLDISRLPSSWGSEFPGFF